MCCRRFYARILLNLLLCVVLGSPHVRCQKGTFAWHGNVSMNQQYIIENTTSILDGLLEGYDQTLHPGFGGNVTQVVVDIAVRSMGPISERDMSYSFDCYFRQLWIDRRLAFTGPMKSLSLNINMLNRIWRPDTYFHNGKQSYLHTITYPNRLLRIKQNGVVLYSQRLTIQAACPMFLQHYPMDMQSCPLIIGSFGYATPDLVYRWKGKPAFSPEVVLSQFDLVGAPVSTMNLSVKGEAYGMITVNFQLRRRMGFFLIQVYLPCCLLVVLSWVGFWIHKDATSDRIMLGITTVLTMAFLALDSRSNLPKVVYSTALDRFLTLCFSYLLGTILEFAGVHYFSRNSSSEQRSSSCSSTESSPFPSPRIRGASLPVTALGTTASGGAHALTGPGARRKVSIGSVTVIDSPTRRPRKSQSSPIFRVPVPGAVNCVGTTRYSHHNVPIHNHHIMPREDVLRPAMQSVSSPSLRRYTGTPAEHCGNPATQPSLGRVSTEHSACSEVGYGTSQDEISASFSPDRATGRRSSSLLKICNVTAASPARRHTVTFAEISPLHEEQEVFLFPSAEENRFFGFLVDCLRYFRFPSHFRRTLLENVDKFCRVAFPVTFGLINLLYWYSNTGKDEARILQGVRQS